MSEYSYNSWASMSDKALVQGIGKFIQHHRLNQNLSQDSVARAAGISRSTLSILERGGKVTLSSLIQVLRVLDLLHIMDVFKVDTRPSPLAYAKLKLKERKHASGMVAEPTEEEDLGW